MSTFRPPLATSLPSEIESNASADQLRQGVSKSAASALDDIPPVSTRLDKLPPTNPLAQRPSSFMPAVNPNARPLSPAASTSPNTASRCSKGGIYLATRILEKKHGAFFISRLILASGINLRGFDSSTIDDPATVVKFVKTLRNMLSPADMAGLMSQTPSLMNMK